VTNIVRYNEVLALHIFLVLYFSPFIYFLIYSSPRHKGPDHGLAGSLLKGVFIEGLHLWLAFEFEQLKSIWQVRKGVDLI
jgi:hypothetical protein